MNIVLDRTSAFLRIAGVVTLLPYVFWVAISGHSAPSAHLLTLGAALVGGAVIYHLLTSVRRCHGCTTLMANFGIGRAMSGGKQFTCRSCGQSLVSREGFVWLSDVTG